MMTAMGAMGWVGVAFVVYVIIGILVTMMLSQTPCRDIPWWNTILLWPLFVIALFQ